MAGKHGWNSLENYLHVVLRVVEDDPFVVSHNLKIQPSPEAGEVSGDVICHEDVILDVDKYFEVRLVGRRREARTVRYSYHARYKTGEHIFRYDNAHAYPGHATSHHKHEFDSTGNDTVIHVGTDWPHLSEVLDELKTIVWR